MSGEFVSTGARAGTSHPCSISHEPCARSRRRSVLLAALVGCLVSICVAAPSAGAAVSAPTVKLTTNAAGASGVDYRVFFTATSGLGASNASITLTAPAGTSFAGTTASVIDLHANKRIEQCCATLSNSNATIKIPVGTAPSGEKLEVWLKNVANPSVAAASVHMTVFTSADPTPVSSAGYAIVVAHGVSTPTARLTTAAAGATGVDYRLTFTTSATGALNGNGGSVTVAAPAGTSFLNSSVVVTDTLTGQNVATCCVTLSNSNATIKIPVAGSAAGDQLTVWLKNVANPSVAAASVHMTVFTSADPTPVSSAGYAIVTAHPASTPAVVLSSTAPNATGVQYSVTFSASSTGALSGTGGWITIAAPAGTSFAGSSNVTVIDESADDINIASCCATLSNGNATIKISVAGSAALDRLQVILQNATNPATPAAGSRRLTVTTSADPLASQSGLY
jgi:hypothetical protein